LVLERVQEQAQAQEQEQVLERELELAQARELGQERVPVLAMGRVRAAVTVQERVRGPVVPERAVSVVITPGLDEVRAAPELVVAPQVLVMVREVGLGLGRMIPEQVVSVVITLDLTEVWGFLCLEMKIQAFSTEACLPGVQGLNLKARSRRSCGRCSPPSQNLRLKHNQPSTSAMVLPQTLMRSSCKNLG